MWRSISLAAAMALLLACASKGSSTASSAPPAGQPAPPAGAAGAPLNAQQLDELVARVALYPDELLALVLPASTQPTQILQAASFLEARKRDPQLTPMEGWDPAVRSLLNYPDVIRLMSADQKWTQMSDAGDFAKGRQVGDPYRGYFYKVLKRQGSHPPGGAYDYVINGNMIAGYAMLAWPADYGVSGVMTFVLNQQGKVFQKNLGPKTSAIAAAMTRYDPDASWTEVTE